MAQPASLTRAAADLWTALRRPATTFLPLLVALPLAAGCEKEKAPAKAEKTDAARADEIAIDPNLKKVLPVASAAPSDEEGDGPPSDGVLAAARADREAAVGSLPTLKVGSTGTDPKLTIVAQPPPGSKAKGVLRLSLRTGPRSALPTVDFALALESAKPKEASAEAPAPVLVTAKVVAASLAPTQPGAIPDEIARAVKKLAGTKVSWSVNAAGGATGLAYELAKGADPGLDQAVRSAVEAVGTLAVAAPAEPVGSGAYWMVTSREKHSGADVVAYRLCKVTAVEGDTLTMTVSTKRYSVGRRIDLAGLAPGQTLEIVEFAVQSEATLKIGPKPFPSSAEITDTIGIGLKPAGQPDGPAQQRMGLTAEARSVFTLAGAGP